MKSHAAASKPVPRTQPTGVYFTFFMVLATFLLVSALAFSQTAGHRAFGKDVKPADPDFSFTLGTFDCSARDTFNLDMATSFSISDSTIGASSILDAYSCLSWPEEGPEVIYQLDISTEMELFAGLRDLDLVDLDIFLLGGCDTETCLTGHNTEFTMVLSPGTYYLVVDGYGRNASDNLAGSTFTLSIEGRLLGIPPSICLENGATPITCATSTIEFDAQLFEKPNLVQSYDCSPNILRGGEHWFAVTLEPDHGFTASALSVAQTFDMAFWLFDGCGPEASCLAYSDDKNAGEGETISYTNELETTATVYLAADGFRAAGSEYEGTISLEFDCQSYVATVPVNMGSLRSLYR